MKRIFLIVAIALAGCADQGGPRAGQASTWLDTPLQRPAELPNCPPRSKAWCAAGPQDVSCNCIPEQSFQTQLSELLR